MGFGDHNLNLPDGVNFAPSAEKVAAMSKLLRAAPFHLGTPASNREAWNRWRDHPLGRHWIAEAESFAIKDKNRITNELIAQSSRSASRAVFTEITKEIRERLTALTFAECLEPTGKYLALIEEDIRSFEGLITWINPAHDDSGKNCTGETIEIDLSSVQFAAMFACIDYLLADRLGKETRAMIRTEIENRIFAPFRERIESGKDIYWWVTCTHNWNTVCLNGILTCALWLKEDHVERAWYLALVDDLIKYSNQGFEQSGFYTEGMSYWVYGFGNYVAISELVRAATDGQIDWLKEPLQNKMAHYGVRMEVQAGLYPTFADSQLTYEPINWLTHWLNNRQDEDPAHVRSTGEEINLFDQLDKQSMTTVLLNMFHTVDGQHAYKLNDPFPLREWFDDVQFLICRPRADAAIKMAATFKGGHNGVNHNHNDLGTFAVAVGDKYLVCDPGLETYTKRTFSQQRYHSDLLNSFGHPVPVIAGELQAPGKDENRAGYGSHAHARVLETSFSDSCDRVTLDLTKAYEVDSLTSLKRTFLYDRVNAGRIEIVDNVIYTSPQDFETSLITYAEWKLNDDGTLTISDGDAAIRIKVSAENGALEVSHCVIQESATPTRLSWKLAQPAQNSVVRITITSLKGVKP